LCVIWNSHYVLINFCAGFRHFNNVWRP